MTALRRTSYRWRISKACLGLSLLVSLAASLVFFFGPLNVRCVYSRSQTNTKSAKEACGRVNETAAVSRPLAFVASPRRDGGYPYDVIALLACSPGLRRRHFAPHAHTVRGATHYIVGLGSNATHVRDPDGLGKALADGVRDGLVDGDVGLPLPE